MRPCAEIISDPGEAFNATGQWITWTLCWAGQAAGSVYVNQWPWLAKYDMMPPRYREAETIAHASCDIRSDRSLARSAAGHSRDNARGQPAPTRTA